MDGTTMEPGAKSIYQIMLEQRVDKLQKDQEALYRSVHGDPFVTGAMSLRLSLDQVSARLRRLEIGQYVMMAVMVMALIVYVVSS